MKKFLLVLIALAVTLTVISCSDESGNPGITGESQDIVSTQSSQNDVPADVPQSSIIEDKDPDDGIQNEEKVLFATLEDEKTEYYKTLDCGEYVGDAFNGADGKSCYYSIIKTYDELCRNTMRGGDYKEEVFENNYVVAIYRPYYYRTPGDLIGYKGFGVSRGVVTIERHSWYADFTKTEVGEWVDVHYFAVPREQIDMYDSDKAEQAEGNTYSLPTVGLLNISSKKTMVYDTAYYVPYMTPEYENGQAWLIEPQELEQFLEDNGLTARWNRTCDCECGYYACSTAYKILIIYHEKIGAGILVNEDIIGYRDAEAFGDTLTITREYKSYGSRQSNIPSFEFIAIPNYALNGQSENISKIEIKSIEHATSSCERNTISLSNKANVEEKSYDYYDLLDLGIYYYYDKLPKGDAYHIITDYEELKKYVENPFISEEELRDNYVVVIKIDGYEYERLENYIYGIRDLGFDENGVLYAVADCGYCRDDLELEVINHYPTNILYTLVPKNELDVEGKELMGCLNLTQESDEGSYRHIFTGISKKYAGLDQVWMVSTYAAKDSLEALLEIDLDPYITALGNGELYLVYYGKLRTNPYFKSFRIDGNKMYIDVVQDAGEEDIRGYYYVIKLENCLDYNESHQYKMNITKYTREPKTIRRGEYLTEALYSYVLSNDAYVSLIKTPNFEWKLIDSYDMLAEVLAEYGGIYPNAQLKDIDFETAYILAHYTIEGCTGCHSAASFENVRYGNGCLYVDKYYDGHQGGDAESPCLYFIAIPKEKVTGEITNAVVLKKNTYAASLHKRVNSEYLAHIVSDFKELPEFQYIIIESQAELEALYEKYADTEALSSLLSLDFDNMCIVAYVSEYDSSLVLGGFRNMRVENNKIFIEKYIEAKDMLGSNDALYTTLHLIAVEKTFIPEEINEVVDICEIDWL